MFTSLRVAALGAQAQQRSLDLAANNLANVETTGFKITRADLVDTRPMQETLGVRGADGIETLDTREVGLGVRVGGQVHNFAEGATRVTGRPLDIAIVGTGFLQVTLADGRQAYTRDGALNLDGAGRLTTNSGALVSPGITAPPGSTGVRIDRDGQVFALFGADRSQPIGSLVLARFTNVDGLEAIGNSLFVSSDNSGDPVTGSPGTNGLGTILSNALEGSNVDVADEFVRIIQAQRAYQVNLRALRTIDEMMQEANNLRR